MTFSRRVVLKAGAAGALAGISGCISTNPATGRSSFTGVYSPADDVALGRREHPAMLEAFGGEYRRPTLQRYVADIGRRLSEHTEFRQFPYQFTLLNTPIVNAFALPGGYVYLSRGLLALASNEAEMAGVLAHELGHVNARHSAERMSAQQMAQLGVLAGALGASLLGLPADSVAQIGQTIAQLSIQGYSRQQEFEADTLGVRYMSRAGYDADAMVTFLSTLREQSQVEARALGLAPGTVDAYNMMSTHPRTIDRVRAAQEAANVQRAAVPRVGRDDYLAQIDGMLFGDDPEQGFVVGRRFVHPQLRFEFTVPEGFRLQNDPDKVLAQDRGGAAIVFDIARIQRARSIADYLQGEWATSARLQDLRTFEVNGMRAATARTTGRGPRGAADIRLVAIDRDGRSAYRLMFFAPRERSRELAPAFERTTFSLRSLSPREASGIQPLRLRVRPARPGDRVESLAAALPYGAHNGDWFRVLNDLPPGAQPTPNEPLKVFSA